MAMLILSLATPDICSADGSIKSALEKDPQGWVDIMPPTDLSGWVSVPCKTGAKVTRMQWHVDNGLLTCDGDGGHDMLLLKREIGNAIFHVEFCFTKIGNPNAAYNSGVWVRTLLDSSIWHQAQVQSVAGGYLFGVTPTPSGPTRFKIKTDPCRVTEAGNWNTFEITAEGPRLSLWVNGYVTAVLPDCAQPKGYLGLEAEGYRIQFRNLKLKELP